ncbi:uncharacterized protein CEXT_64231 [Caerostris extrusa]|uniref:Uncharacterized protein n=1 Tax=Caerostris extrusa TaxID=172846 RepID=A0AAV4W4P7_CAEEX|nr:uncharacterized protein CEXT_64231 [Caerostris extrusa]
MFILNPDSPPNHAFTCIGITFIQEDGGIAARNSGLTFDCPLTSCGFFFYWPSRTSNPNFGRCFFQEVWVYPITRKSLKTQMAMLFLINGSNGQWAVRCRATKCWKLFLLNYNKYFSNKIVGTYGLVLQKLIEDGHLRVSDSLVDVNNMPTEIVLLFDVNYNAPDGSVGEWSTSAMQGESFDDDRQALIVIEHNIANLERSINNRQQQQQQQQQQIGQDVDFPHASQEQRLCPQPRVPQVPGKEEVRHQYQAGTFSLYD